VLPDKGAEREGNLRIVDESGEGLMRTQLPLLLVQEGGYNLRNIKRGGIALFNGLQAGHLG